ncbi:MAG: MaoC/PaaZ C-terminal domain-containing protein [Actinomycetota bacterium]
MESVHTPVDLVGRTVGPVDVAVSADRVALYVDTTGADGAKWHEAAPPGFASVLLFAVADEFLYHPDVIAYTATLLHLDQSFTYLAPIRIGSTVRVEGTVARVRERAGSYFVTFDAHASDGRGPVMESRSTFVLSDRTAPLPQSVRDEPPVRERATNSGSERSASRHDLVRYAAATTDFNPLHWDHGFAVDSGLPGTVVHGLLMYAWMVQQASDAGGGRAVTSAKIRFRSALHPAQQATIATSVAGDDVSVTLSCAEDQLVTGSVTLAVAGT